jgi:hypothetical protein
MLTIIKDWHQTLSWKFGYWTASNGRNFDNFQPAANVRNRLSAF